MRLSMIFLFGFMAIHGFAQNLQTNVFSYASQPLNHATHLMMMGGYRAYQPRQGDFIKQDSDSPFLNHRTLNGYNYAMGNPMIAQDPSGHMAVGWWFAYIGAGIGAWVVPGSVYVACVPMPAEELRLSNLYLFGGVSTIMTSEFMAFSAVNSVRTHSSYFSSSLAISLLSAQLYSLGASSLIQSAMHFLFRIAL